MRTTERRHEQLAKLLTINDFENSIDSDKMNDFGRHFQPIYIFIYMLGDYLMHQFSNKPDIYEV